MPSISLSNKFEKEVKSLDAQQRQVYDSTGHCVVLAGPGSGKTKTLVTKLGRMLLEDVRPPRGIACITYSNETVRELERRLKHIELGQAPNLFVGTVHTFCLANIVLPYWRLANIPLPENFRIADSEQNQILEELGVQNKTDFHKFRRTVLDRKSDEWKGNIGRKVEEYEQRLHERGFVDFDDMVLWGLQIIEQHEWARKLIKARFPILVIDEYQDLGLPLHRLVEVLCLQSGIRLLAVGDPNQSIYGFLGAKPELLKKLAQDARVQNINLKINYRNGRGIIKPATNLVSGSAYQSAQSVSAGFIQYYEIPKYENLEGIDAQAKYVCDKLIPSITGRGGIKPGNIGILYLDRNDGDAIFKASQKKSLKTIRIDQGAHYRKTELTRWLESCAAWCVSGWHSGEPSLSTLIKRWDHFFSVDSQSDAMRWESKRNLIRFLWKHRILDSEQNKPLRDWLNEFYEYVLKLVFFDRCRWQDEYCHLKKILENVAIGKAMETVTLTEFAGQIGHPDFLNLITLHSVKGLEFDEVIMIGLEDGRIPWLNDSDEKINEKRRLFYVGLTRARKGVHLVYSGFYYDKQQRRENGKSRFIKELENTIEGER